MQFRNLILALLLPAMIAPAKTEEDQEAPKVETIQWEAAYARPGYASIEAFAESVNSRQQPWGELLMPDAVAEFERPAIAGLPLSETFSSGGVFVVRRNQTSAIVFADNKHFRSSPFCAVVFLLSRTGGQFHVTDFIRRSEGYESYSDVAKPTMLKLQPDIFPHLRFTQFLGGRKCEFDTDEFYVVRHNKFQRTLLLKNGGAYFSPADPYREFGQDADIRVKRGKLCVAVRRFWTTDDERKQEQTFTAGFRWNGRLFRFIGPKAGMITCNAPESLPRP